MQGFERLLAAFEACARERFENPSPAARLLKQIERHPLPVCGAFMEVLYHRLDNGGFHAAAPPPSDDGPHEMIGRIGR